MDKKSIILGIVFLVGGFLLMSYNSMQDQKTRQERLLQQAQENERAVQESDWAEAPETVQREIVSSEPSTKIVEKVLPEAPIVSEKPEEVVVQMENEELLVTLSSYGGAIENILLKNYPSENPHQIENPRKVVLNRVSDQKALALNRSNGDRLTPLAHFYELAQTTDRSVIFRATLPSGMLIERHYELTTGEDPDSPNAFIIKHRTILRNPGEAPVTLDRTFLNLGTAAPTDADYMGFNLNASYFENGDYDNIPASKFSGGGFLFFKSKPKDRIEESGILQWGAVKNQFFVTIYTPETPAAGIVARGIRFPQDPATGKVPMGVTASLKFDIPTVLPGEQHVMQGDFYAGPKDFDRLSQMNLKQEDVMQLGWFLGLFLGLIAFVAKMLLTLMGAIHGFIGNWGFAIILTTLVIRAFLWPLTAKAARASKRMQKLQKPLQEIREKYQDNPQKLNQEMMNLWKKHKINPLSGCWPVLIQFPIFIAFFNLLRNSAQLRFAEFLWINDLSMPDATIPLPGDTAYPLVGTAINILPFIWVVSMYFQMKMMPQPSIDNAQTKIIKFMPFIFFPFTYYFSSGLVLYWTTTNCFSIFQQYITNRTRDEEDVAIEEEIAEMEDKKKGKLRSGPLISKKKKKKGGPGKR